MLTRYLVIRADGRILTRETELPAEPGYHALQALIEPLLGDGEPMEHVTVLHEGQRRDMFVSELGKLALTTRGPLPLNPTATAMYQAALVTQYRQVDVDNLPAIHGDVVLFPDREVWV